MSDFDEPIVINGKQMKAARKLLGWSTTTLAKQSGQPVMIVTTIEDSGAPLDSVPGNALKRIRGALEDAGVAFDDADDEVRLRF
jgi:ribosome-binding protein aMBF1 (putative translation factor)